MYTLQSDVHSSINCSFVHLHIFRENRCALFNENDLGVLARDNKNEKIRKLLDKYGVKVNEGGETPEKK